MNNFFDKIPENISINSSASDISDLTCPFSLETEDFDPLTDEEIINIKRIKKANLFLIEESHNNAETLVTQKPVKCGCSFLTLFTWRKG